MQPVNAGGENGFVDRHCDAYFHRGGINVTHFHRNSAIGAVAVGLLLVVVLLVDAGCRPPKPKFTPAAEELTELGGDAEPALMDIANDFRVDGEDQVIEFDLREADDFSAIGEMFDHPKLRSLLLADSNAGDQELELIGKLPNLENLDLRGCPVSDAGIEHLRNLKKLKALKLSGKKGKTMVTDRGFEVLGQIPTLKVLAADFLPITDAGIASLGPLRQVRELYLAKTRITGRSVSTIQGFGGLTKLRLASTEFDDDGVASIGSLTELVDLDVSECAAITDAAAKTFVKLPKLSKLNLYGTSLGDEAMDALGTARQITWLNVDKTSVTDRGLVAIGNLDALTFLHLGSTVVTNAGLDSLQELKNLKKLIVTRTAVTADGVQALSAHLPSTEIQLEYEPGK
ncbi:MAG: hypothetical protein AAFU85_22430 [Planctomycetota bacterium]